MLTKNIDEKWLNNFYNKFKDELTIDKYEENLASSGGVKCFNMRSLCCIDICEQHYLNGIITKEELFEYIMKIRELIANGKLS
jgi:hypothetical protein